MPPQYIDSGRACLEIVEPVPGAKMLRSWRDQQIQQAAGQIRWVEGQALA